MTKTIATTLATFWLLGLVFLCPAAADQEVSEATTVKEGDAFPKVESTDDQGQLWLSADHVGKKILVLYFYPGDFTSGCMKQAEKYREGWQKLADLDVEVVGVSGDSVPTHKLFKNAQCLSQTLLSDPEGRLAQSLGVPVGKGGKARTRDLDGQTLLDAQGKSIIVSRDVTLARWTYIIDREGRVLSRRANVNPATDAEEVLKLLSPPKP